MLVLVDDAGRLIPSPKLAAAVCDAARSFYVSQPDLADPGARLVRFSGTGLVPGLSAAGFTQRTGALVAQLHEDKQASKLLSGVHLPIVVPKTAVSDLGRTTEAFVEAAGKSYTQQFPNRQFTNYRTGELEKQVTFVPESRYGRLTSAIQEKSVVGIYFPNPMQGFSVFAQREAVSSLPEGFILSGPLDGSIGQLMYPDVLARDSHTPGYDCSAVQWRSAERSLDFRADDGAAKFGGRAYLSSAYGGCSGGLLFVG